MFSFLNFRSNIVRIGFETMKKYMMMMMMNKNGNDVFIINTLSMNEQHCLLLNTLEAQQEEKIINDFVQDYNFNVVLVVYGKNAYDLTAENKCKELMKLGFCNVHWYVGGMFEWLLLQELYGKDEFPTTHDCKDLLYYR